MHFTPLPRYYTCRKVEYQQYFEKTKIFPKKHLLFAANFAIICKCLFWA